MTDCAHRGHCFHRADGSLFERHSGNPNTTVKVFCCDCPTSAVVSQHARHTQRSLAGAIRKEHGPHLPQLPPAA